MPSQGSDFDQLRRAAQQQDAAKQVQLAKEREKQDREAAQRRAAEDAKAKQERERNREMLKKREEIRQRRQEEEAKLAAQRQEWKRQQAEKASKAAREAVRNAAARPESKSSDKVVTKKMIRDRESIGLGRSSSGKATSSRSRGEGTSSFESVPLTRQEKRDRKNREALGLTGKGAKALMGASRSTKKASQVPGTSAANRLNASMAVPTSIRDATGTQSRTTVSKNPSSAGSATQPSSSKRIQALEKDLKQLTAFRERLSAGPQSKENDLKLRNTEAAEREAKRSIAMERKREEQAQLARIKAGLPPLSATADAASERSDRDARGVKRGREDEDGSKGPTPPSRPETARERFLREEQERKAKAKADKAAGVASKKSMQYEEDDEDDEDDEDEDDEESLDDFIDDEDPDEEQQDIWSMINPGKERPKYMNTSRDDYDDDDDDMEADIDSMTREELRSSRAGREEDKREEAELNRRAREKALLKQKRGLGR